MSTEQDGPLGAPAVPGRIGWDRLAWLAIALGVVLRGVALRADHPLGLDEAMVALNVMERSHGALLQPLDHDQAAPPPSAWGMSAGNCTGAPRMWSWC